MNNLVSISAITPLRQRLIDDMEVRRFSRETQRNYIRDIGRFAAFLRRSPDTATAEDVRRFQIEQLDAGVPVPTMNSNVSALRFFLLYTTTRTNAVCTASKTCAGPETSQCLRPAGAHAKTPPRPAKIQNPHRQCP